jgi:hypothetical protein
VTYILEQPGTFELPAVELRWWNVDEQKVEAARADAVTLIVQPNPTLATTAGQGDAADVPTGFSLIEAVRRAWPWLVAAAVLLAALAWLMPRAMRVVVAWRAERRRRYLESEAYWFSRFRAATRSKDLRHILSALLAWIDRFPIAHPTTLDAFATAAGDPKLAAELSRLTSALYGPPDVIDRTGTCSPQRLRRLISTARRRLRRAARHPAGVRSGRLPPLNPESTIRSAHLNRAPAR